jgi:hypothetical protein
MNDTNEEICGKYCQIGKENVLVLNKDGTFCLVENGKTGNGKFRIEGDCLVIEIEHRSTIDGNCIIDGFGRKWNKQL